GKLRKTQPPPMWPPADQGSQNCQPRTRIRVVDPDLVIKAPFTNNRRIEVVKPISRGDDQQPERFAMCIELLQQCVDCLLLMQYRCVLTLGDNRVEFIEEEQAWCSRARFFKNPLDGFRSTADVLADGALEGNVEQM